MIEMGEMGKRGGWLQSTAKGVAPIVWVKSLGTRLTHNEGMAPGSALSLQARVHPLVAGTIAALQRFADLLKRGGQGGRELYGKWRRREAR